MRLAEVRAGWGERAYLENLAREWAPEAVGDAQFRDWFIWHMRRSLSPGAALTSFRAAMDLDVRDVLGAVRVPTLILPRATNLGAGSYTAERIRGSQVVTLPGFRGVYTWIDDRTHQATMQAMARFISRLDAPTRPERVLATILFTDIVGSTDHASRLGDRDLLARHHATRQAPDCRLRG